MWKKFGAKTEGAEKVIYYSEGWINELLCSGANLPL